MKQSTIIEMLFLTLAALSSSQSIYGLALSKSGSKSTESDSPGNALIDPLHTFGASLFKKIRNNKENLILSPISIHSALGMLLLGATPNSQTEKDLQESLKISRGNSNIIHDAYLNVLKAFKTVSEEGAKSPPKQIFGQGNKTAPSIDAWTMAISKGEANISPEFIKKLKQYYSSSIRQVSDSKPEDKKLLVGEINKWAQISGFGGELITEDQLNEKFSMILLSAIGVKSSWFESFNEFKDIEMFHNYGLRNNSNKLFTVLSIGDVWARFIEFSDNQQAEHKVLTDHLTAQHPGHLEGLLDLNCKAVTVNLAGNLSYTILMPINTNTGDELQQLEDRLLSIDPKNNQTKLARTLQALELSDASHKLDFVRMPAFKFENDIDLKESLTSIGLERIFDKDKAEFSKISQTNQFVSGAKHQSVIEVNKDGLKAAAVTTINISLVSARIVQHPIKVIIDNPFMFIIRYNDIPLFIGHVVKV